jgi:hypothetical protein
MHKFIESAWNPHFNTNLIVISHSIISTLQLSREANCATKSVLERVKEVRGDALQKQRSWINNCTT